MSPVTAPGEIEVRHIDTTPDVRSGRARIKNTRITVDDIVVMHLRLGQSLPEIAGKYSLEPAAVHAAMAYYYDHKADVDRLIAGDEEYVEAFKEDHPSRLRERLRTLNGS